MIKFPRIYRFFTENPLLTVLVSFLIALVVLLIGLDLSNNLRRLKTVQSERQEIKRQLQYWQEITSKYKNYRDGYFALSLLEYRLRDFDKAKFYLQKVLEIDPNFDKGKELGKKLNSQD